MIKRFLGIHKMERNFQKIGESMTRSWEWIHHLNTAIKEYERRINDLENNYAGMMELTQQLVNKIEEQNKINEEVRAPFKSHNTLPDKDLTLLQVLYQYAAFESSNAISTNNIFQNLPFKITERGLRKKLMALEDNGTIRSIKKGNVRYWYFNTGAISKIKAALKEKE